ncbi:MAG: hypothetical protein WCI73_04605 [Phycisphaerae bacterium]
MTPERMKSAPRQQSMAEPPAIALARELGRLIGKHVAQTHSSDAKPSSESSSNAVDPGIPAPDGIAEN